MGKNDSTNISAIHHDAFLFTHPLLLCDEELSYFFDRCDLRRSVSDLKGANLFFDIGSIEHNVLSIAIVLEADVNVIQSVDKLIYIQLILYGI